MKQKPLFEISLITRNEEKTLPHLFESLKEFKERGGLTCILDTGSTDNTVKIAKEWGCKIREVGSKYVHMIDKELADKINEFFVEGNESPIVKEGDTYFDFSGARNESSEIGDSDYKCTVDADEVLTHLNIDKINKYIEDEYQKFEYNFIFAHLPNGTPHIKFIQSKFFDRRICKWIGSVHEMCEGNARTMLLDESDFLLEHYQNVETNRTGYLRGLAVDCYLHQEKDRNSHYAAREFLWNGRPLTAIKEFKRHINMNRWAAEKAESMLFLADIYKNMGDKEQQVYWYHKALYTEPNRREPLVKLAQFYKELNQPIIANMYATASLELPWYPFYSASLSSYTYEPHEVLYWAAGWMGNVPKAQKHILECLKYQPYNPIYLRDTKYYFDYLEPSIDGWMTFIELDYLFHMAKQHMKIAELGSWKGRSTHALASGCRGTVTAIDTWMGSQETRDDTNWMAKQEDVYAVFKENTKQFGNLTSIRGKGSEIAPTITDKSFDAVFIDAGHTYEEVKEDIENWLPKAKMVLCGHDYQPDFWMGVVQAVDEKFGKPDEIHGSIWVKYLVPKVTFVIPTLGRPEGLKRCLDSIEKLNYPKAQIEIIVIDGEGTVPQKMARGLWQSKGEYIVFASNDVEFTPDSLYNALQHDKGVVAFNTGDVGFDKGNICEHFIIKKYFVKKIGGEIFDTEFFHVGCDNLLYAKSNKLGEFERADDAIVYHYHWSKTDTEPTDEVYAKGWAHVQEDRELLEKKLAELQ